MKNISLTELYRESRFVRCFEESVLEMFGAGELSGTTHTCIGQEVVEASTLLALQPDDLVFSNHRGHGHFLIHVGNPVGLLAEMMGKTGGVCGGRGGSQHLHAENFYSNGVLGNLFPVAAGAAMAEKLKKTGKIVCAFLGDGAMGQGVVYETLNMAALWKLPLLVVLEDNHYSQTTLSESVRAGRLSDRFWAFGVPVSSFDRSIDPEIIFEYISHNVESIRCGESARAVLLDTYRLAPHSKGDDFRSAEELSIQWKNDPLLKLRQRLDWFVADQIDESVESELADCVRRARDLL